MKRSSCFSWLLLLVVIPLWGAEKPEGGWRWNLTTPNGDLIESSLKLKQEGDQLTGVFTGRGVTNVPVENLKYSEGTVAFAVARERNGQKTFARYAGKLEGDTITGKVESNFGGETRTRNWVARRETGQANVSGTWKYALTVRNGQTFEPTLKLKQEKDVVTGIIVFNENEAPITEGKVKGDEVTLKIVRERDGQTFTSKYQGKVEGNSIKGKIDSDWGGQERSYEWNAKRTRE